LTASAAARPARSAARLLAGVGSPPTLAQHLLLYGPLPRVANLVELLHAAALTGRGGAAFPAARKLRAVAAADGRAVIVANAAEGEPISKKDAALLRVAPHLVLDGAALAARAVRASEVVVGITRPAPELLAAVRERSRRADGVAFEVARVPAAFVAGEETALLRALGSRDGKPKPTTKPPYPFERGLRGRPTLVQNVETLAHMALLARYGPEWFGAGTALVTLTGAVAQPGVHEVPFGITLTELLASCGGVTADVAGILVGGYFGRWLAPAAAHTLTLTPETLGAGAIAVLPASTCATAEVTRVAQYLAGESAGQCGPCVHGLPALAAALNDRAGRKEAARLGALVTGRGACRHPDGVARFVTSALEVFREDFGRHAARGTCGRRDERVLPTALGA
jgi:NADH:ubiquinone oxidoreductase subunit F (NADH-binding)